MAAYRNRRIFAAALLAVSLAGVGIWFGSRADAPTAKRRSERSGTGQTPKARATASRYLNTKPGAEYVGSDACIECHRDQHASFKLTPHNHALALVDLAKEPPDVEFLHKKSGLTYRVYRKDGAMRHREVLSDSKRGDMVLGDYPVASRIGSGHHSRSYLIDISGFLVESPVTWYAARNKWEMSPGYDVPRHWGFTRLAHEGCVHCHAGRVHSVKASTQRVRFEEMKIGCESCHGPGSLHVKLRSERPEATVDVDLTIVNPAGLSRRRNEAICGRCHLRGAALSNVHGRSRNDFRPGLLLTDFRVDYRTGRSTESMNIVGHFEQLYASRCYTKSSDMTCTTCHNPHGSPAKDQKVSYYRRKCLECHEDDGGCRLEEKTRLAKSPQNDCVSCHMPAAETDIPHFAFTHHRIGLKHSLDYRKRKNSAPVRLIPMRDVSQLPRLERERCLGLAYLQYANSSEDDFQEVYHQRAFDLLKRVYDAGARDGVVLAALARLHWDRNQQECVVFAEAALKSKDCTPLARTNALIVLGDTRLANGEFESAKSAFLKLTEIRRASVDWRMLGICQSKENDSKSAIASFRRAISIRRDDPDLRRLLAAEAARAGNRALADEQLKIVKRLQEAQPRPDRKPP